MTDDLDDIKAMMDRATPRPDPARRAENLALAQKNFDALQGSRPDPRPTSIKGRLARSFGVKTMMATFSSRGALTATTALVACGILLVSPFGPNLRAPTGPIDGTLTEETAKTQAPAVPAPAEVNNRTAADIAQGQISQGIAADAERAEDQAISPEASLEVMEAPLVVMDAVAPRSRVQANDGGTASLAGAPNTFASPAASSDPTGIRPSNTEAFPDATPNPLKVTAESPVSTFSIDVDTASYAVVRSSLMAGQLPPKDAVRIEEMINYFPYDYPAPGADEAPFRPTVSTMQTPWNPDTRLVHVALQGQMPAVESRPPLNLVFLIDTSGSMGDSNKLPLLKQSLMLMLDQLRPEDEVAIVTYAGSAGQVLAPTPAREKGMILTALARLGAGGATNGQGGLEQAYAVASQMAQDGEVSRVLLATDGDFNVGINDPDALKDFIADKRDTGTYLSVLGFGRGNLDDATMQALAQNGNGTAAYIDTLSEAQKVLVDQLTGALFTIAGDVKIQVEWNPAQIAEYRLIGYETRALNREDFNNDKVDAGEMGAGHSVTAIYEVTPVGSPAQLSDPLRYQPENVVETSDEWGFLKLRYKDPGADESQLLTAPITAADTAGTDAQFAAAIAGFGQLLRGEAYLGDWSYADAIALATASRGEDPFGYRSEAVRLMRLAEGLSQ